MGGSLAEAVPQAAADGSPLEGKSLFVPGETLTWDVTFAGVPGGRARLAVGAIGSEEGRRLVVIRAEAESAGVVSILGQTQDTLSSWIDVDTGLPTRTEAISAGSGKRLVVHAARVAGQTTAEVRVWSAKSGDEGTTKIAKLPNTRTHDPLSAILALRGWDAQPGGRATVYSLGAMRVWKSVFLVEGREEVDGPLGHRRVIRIRATATRMTPALAEDTSKPPRTFTVWLTDDKERIPVRFSAHTELGDVVAKITSYTASD